mgnify:FL=1
MICRRWTALYGKSGGAVLFIIHKNEGKTEIYCNEKLHFKRMCAIINVCAGSFNERKPKSAKVQKRIPT